MGKATGRDLHLDRHLSNVAVEYRPRGMIADMVAPIVPVNKQSNTYPIWSQADALRIEDDARGPGTEANKITRSVSSDTYFCRNYALKNDLTLEDRENMDEAYVRQLREGRVQTLKDKLMLNWEYRLAAMVTDSTYVGSYSTVISDWEDHANGNSDPIGDMFTGIKVVEDLTGFTPNRVIMGMKAWREFRQHADVIDVINGNERATSGVRWATQEQAARMFDLDQFLVGNAFYNSADEGQSLSLTRMWLDYVLIYYAPMRPSLQEPSYMYSFRWQKAGIPNMQAERHPFDPKTKSEEVELGYYQDEKVVVTNLAYLLTHVTSV